MSNQSINNVLAFYDVKNKARSSDKKYVSLYRNNRWYGGPEEGGWYDTESILIESIECINADTANNIYDEMVMMAEYIGTVKGDEWNNFHKTYKNDIQESLCEDGVLGDKADIFEAYECCEPDSRGVWWSVRIEDKRGECEKSPSVHYQ